MGKQMIYINDDVAPLLKAEGKGNMSTLINTLLRNHYLGAPVSDESVHTVSGMVNKVHQILEDNGPVDWDNTVDPIIDNTVGQIKTGTNIEPTPENAESENGEGLIDGKIEEPTFPPKQPGGDIEDKAVWN